MNEVSQNVENSVVEGDLRIPAFLAREVTKEGDGEKVFAQTAEDAGGQEVVLH
jgi:hypothetical protein